MSERWSDYWARPGAGPRHGGCLPNGADQVRPVLERFWEEFARPLPRKARLLDLGTGDGAVLRTIRGARPDLVLTGVDLAPELPPAPAGIALRGGIAMESLPFRESAFDAATSQFALEYGDVPAALAEAARVLRPGAPLALAIHHSDGPIVRHNMERRAALQWAIGESGLLDKARGLAKARTVAALPTPPSFRAAIAEARAAWPTQSAAAEIATAVADTLDLGARRPPAETLEVLATLEARAGSEIGRLAALREAARDEEGIGEMGEALGRAGFAAEPPRPLPANGGGPVAWAIAARKAQG